MCKHFCIAMGAPIPEPPAPSAPGRNSPGVA